MNKNIFKSLLNKRIYSDAIISRLDKGYESKIDYQFLRYLSTKYTDLEIFLYLHNRFKNSQKFKNYKQSRISIYNHGSKNKYNLLNKYFDISNKIILDIGTEDCHFIKLLRKNENSRAIGINIQTDLYTGYDYVDKDCIIKYDGINIMRPIIHKKTEKYDLISTFMVIHHMDNKEATLKSVYDNLKEGGYFIFKEHDVDNTMYGGKSKKYIDFIHFFYELIENDDFNYKYYSNYDEYYTNKENLTKLLEKIGFKQADKLSSKLKNPFGLMRTYYKVFTK